jgi:hypothetical protein
VKGGIVDRPDAFPWSSDRYYRAGAGPPWLDLDFVLRRLAPTRTGACAAYRRSMGSDDPDAYEVVEAIGRVVKGGEDFAHRSMRHAYVVASRSRWTAPALARAASVVQGFSFQTLRGRTRGRPESRARLIAAFIGRRDHGISTGSLAACFRRDESAFVHGLRRLELAMQRDPTVARHVERIASAIESQTSELQD